MPDGSTRRREDIDDTGYDFGWDMPAFSKARLKITNIRSLNDGYDGDI